MSPTRWARTSGSWRRTSRCRRRTSDAESAKVTGMTETALSRTAASQAVESLGWRYALATLVTSVRVASLAEATQVAVAATGACGDHADDHLRVDLRPDRVELSLANRATGQVTDVDTALARSITTALAEVDHRTAGVTSAELARPVQMLEIAVDALDIPAVRPFWKAVLGYADDPAEGGGPADALVDPAGQLPAVWFQQMDQPRPQRNRIHLERPAVGRGAGGRCVATRSRHELE